MSDDPETVTINGMEFPVVSYKRTAKPAATPIQKAAALFNSLTPEQVAGMVRGAGKRPDEKKPPEKSGRAPMPMTEPEWREAFETPKRSKYGNKPVTVDGVKIDSRREGRRWLELQIMEKGGVIRNLVRQPVFILAPSVKIAGEARARPAMRYKADAAYIVVETSEKVVEDTKSGPTAKTTDWRMRQHLMKSVHNIDVRVIL